MMIKKRKWIGLFAAFLFCFSLINNIAYANTLPVAVDDSTTANSGTQTSINVLGNDTDSDGNALSIYNFSQGSHGTVAQSGNYLLYTPYSGYSGTDSFTYSVSDGYGVSSAATVTVTVNSNGGTITAASDTATTSMGTPVTISVLNNDTNTTGYAMNISGVTQGSNGSVSISGSNLVYTPNANFIGTDYFTYTVTNGNGASSQGTVTVTVSASSGYGLTAASDTATTSMGTPVTISVLNNDTNTTGYTLTLSGVTQGSNGSVYMSGNNVVYTPNSNFIGTDYFTYTETNGNGASAQGTVTVTVGASSSYGITAVNDTITATAGTPVTISVLANDTNTSGYPLSISGVTQGSNGIAYISGTNIIYTPNSSFAGTDTFTYTAANGYGASSQGTVTVIVSGSANSSINAVDDTANAAAGTPVTISVLSNDTSVSGYALSLSSITQPLNGTAYTSGNTVVYTPSAGFSGKDTFTYTVSNGYGGTAKANVYITVSPAAQTAVQVTPASSGTLSGAGIGAGVFTYKDGTVINNSFLLHNTSNNASDSLSASWVKSKKQYNFKLDSVVTAAYANEGLYKTVKGTGKGTVNGVSGYTVSYAFKDATSQTYQDVIQLVIKDPMGVEILHVSGNLQLGNYTYMQ